MSLNTLGAIAIIGGIIALAVLALALRAMRQERQAAAQQESPAAEAQSASPPAAPSVLAEVAPGAESPAQDAPTLPDVQQEPPAATHPAESHPAEATEVLRVLRPPEGGALMIEMEGMRYRNVNEIKDQKHGLELVDVVMELQQFLGLDLVTSLAAAETAEPTSAAAEPPPIEKPSMNPIKQMMILRDRELRKAREKRESAPQPTTIVEEIEAILVKRLIGSPFEGRSIHMRPGLHGGAHIDVDGHGYASIEDVADEDVKAFLKSVIAEWEEGK
jgi:hypothetical protein